MYSPTPSLFDAIWRFKWLVAATVLIVTGLTFATSLLVAPKAAADATVALTAPSSVSVIAPGVQGDASVGRYTSQRALFAVSDSVLSAAAARLTNSSLTSLQRAVTVTASANSTSITVAAVGDTKALAVDIVDAVVQAYRDETSQQVADLTRTALDSIDKSVTKLQQTLATNPTPAIATATATTLSTLTRQAADLQTDSAVFGDGVDFVQAASIDTASMSKIPYRELAVGGLVGLMIGATIAWLLADRRPRITSPRQAESILQAPLLGEIPDLHHVVHSVEDRAEVARTAREIVTPLLAHGAPGVVMITGAERKVGSTVTTLGMATAAAAEGLRVLVIDADLATQGLGSMIGLPANTPGLLELSRDPSLEPSTFVRSVTVGPGLTLRILSSGHLPEGDAVVTTARLQALIGVMRDQFDVIFIDAPTPGVEYIASALASLVDGVIVITCPRANAKPIDDLHQFFELNATNVLGYVFAFAHSAKNTSGRTAATSHVRSG